MTNPAVSIIVPIYNVEKYLYRIITSILEQPFNNFELILVDDGSFDNCGLICDKFAEQDKRIVVIHKVNGGPSSARNRGIEVARGKYIVFIDPDDQICTNYLTKLYNVIEEKKCEGVISGYKTVPTNVSNSPGFKLNTLMSGADFILSSSNVHTSNDLCFSWRNIYKLKLIKEKNIRFNEEIFIGEDTLFNLEFFLESERLYAIPDCLYLYTVNNPDSLTKARFKPKLEDSLALQYKLKKQLSKQFSLLENRQYKKDLANYNINNIFRLMINNLHNCENVSTINDVKRIVNYPIIRESLREIGFLYQCNNLKEYLYFIALKLRIYPLIVKNKG